MIVAATESSHWEEVGKRPTYSKSEKEEKRKKEGNGRELRSNRRKR